MKKFFALMSTVGLALSLGLVTAPASRAVEAGKYEVQHLPGYAQTDAQWGIQVITVGGSGVNLTPKGKFANGTWVTSAYYGSSNKPRNISLPRGKCVWEEVWGNFGKTWYGNFNYGGNDKPYLVTLEGSKLNEANGIESRLRFIQC